jgi:hypothetical protein
MQIDQRHVTTIQMQDGKPRDFVVSRDNRGCKISCVARDEVLNLLISFQEFQRLCQAIAQPCPEEMPEASAGGAAEAAPAVSETTTPGWTTIRVDQRQVTTVALHPSRSREFHLGREGDGYKVSCVSREEVVTLLLSAADFHKLRQQVAKWEWRDVRRERETVELRRDPPEPRTAHVEVRFDAAEAVIREPHEVRRPSEEREACETAGVGRPTPGPYSWGPIDWLGFN